MRTMFVRLAFWFWLAILLSAGLSFFIAINLRLRPEHDRQMHHIVEQRHRLVARALTVYGKNAADLYERGLLVAGPDGTGTQDPYLFTAQGKEIVPGAPSAVTEAVLLNVRGLAPKPSRPPLSDVVIVPVQGPSGAYYLAAASTPPLGPPPFHPHLPLPPNAWVNFVVTFLIGGAVCYGLAWRLTTPIRRLRTATQQLAEGDLAARVEVPESGKDELADLGREFNAMAARIEHLVGSHKQLVRDVSHELRSPLARLTVALELARKATPDAASGTLDRIGREAERLNLLIGELLTLSRLERDGATIQRDRFELSELVDEVVRDAEFEAKDSGRHVAAVLTDPVAFEGNRELLRRALENVVRNGVRYTIAGSAVEVRLLREPGAAVIRVRDHGPGVPEAQLDDIFRPFFRVAEARDRATGGNGIGLAISHGAVTLHGGTIFARNAVGGGLEVEIRLPAGSGV
ncbi:ATP-binding protein [Geomesophilobacter sediminis]|uniref:histidine kinase n=1 Tax=Geomesophilobacter sediminis TaxID=2798584 RepID=A0A8J7M0F8_9BACT|nr:ATP-binding protein [Geomesophilobacter sediminis]MBJ6724962.1 HAMP domain-containing protein [Geomesophilobacter sediminis]